MKVNLYLKFCEVTPPSTNYYTTKMCLGNWSFKNEFRCEDSKTENGNNKIPGMK